MTKELDMTAVNNSNRCYANSSTFDEVISNAKHQILHLNSYIWPLKKCWWALRFLSLQMHLGFIYDKHRIQISIIYRLSNRESQFINLTLLISNSDQNSIHSHPLALGFELNCEYREW